MEIKKKQLLAILNDLTHTHDHSWANLEDVADKIISLQASKPMGVELSMVLRCIFAFEDGKPGEILNLSGVRITSPVYNLAKKQYKELLGEK